MSIAAEIPFPIIEVDVGAPFDPRAVGAGARRCVPITGGRVSGAVEGKIIPGGADRQTTHVDGNLPIEAHYAFRTADGAIVEVLSSGVRAGAPDVLAGLMTSEPVPVSDYYFRTAIRFRAGAPALQHLTFRLAGARGARRKTGVRLELFEVL